jgi:hypothetical protein
VASTPVEGNLGKWLGKAGWLPTGQVPPRLRTLLATALLRGGKAVAAEQLWPAKIWLRFWLRRTQVYRSVAKHSWATRP